MSIPVSDSDVNPQSTLDAALEYIRNGWAVLPLNPRDKRPVGKLVPRGVNDASKDERRIREWFSDNDYNIGIACGDASDGLVIVDYDDMVSTGGRPETIYPTCVLTPNNGWHTYYQYTGDTPLRTYKHEHGEVRWNGAYVVAPPSIHPNGGRYEWFTRSAQLTGISIAELPPAIGTANEPLPTDFSQKPNTERIEHALANIPIWSYRYLSSELVRANADRSGSEWGLVHTLVDNGLSDSDILYVFQSYLSTESHYADHRYPLKYLAHTVGKVRADKEQSHAKTQTTVTTTSSLHPVLQSGIGTDSERDGTGTNSSYTNGTTIGIEQLVSAGVERNERTLLESTNDESDTPLRPSSIYAAARTTLDRMATVHTELGQLREQSPIDSDGTGATDVHGSNGPRSTTTNGWVIRTLSDAYRPRPPLKYVVAGLFAEASLNIVYGPPGSLKSMLLTDMMGAVVAGDVWLKHTLGEDGGFATIQTPALWIDYDNGVRRSDEHFEATGRWYGLPENSPLFYMSMATPWLNPKDDRTMDMLKQFILSYNIGLVIGDNLGLLSGGADENSAEMIPVMGAYRKLAEDTGACIVLVHHQSKNSQSSRRGNSLRGFSGIEGALDLALNIEREDPTTGYVEAHPTKVRGNTIEPFGANFTYEHREGTKDLYRAGFWGMEIKNDKSDNSLRDAVMTHLESGAFSQTDLVAHVKSLMDGVGVNRIRSQIKLMVEQREILEINGGNKNTKYYSLPLLGE